MIITGTKITDESSGLSETIHISIESSLLGVTLGYTGRKVAHSESASIYIYRGLTARIQYDPSYFH